MSSYIPSDIINIIFDYYAQLKNMYWTPFIYNKTGKIGWKFNKYSKKISNINKLLNYRGENLKRNVNIEIDVLYENELINYYNTTGYFIKLREYYILNTLITDIYIEFIDENNFKNYLFCSITKRNLYNKSYKRNNNVFIGNCIHGELFRLEISNNNNNFIIVLDKY